MLTFCSKALYLLHCNYMLEIQLMMETLNCADAEAR